MYRCVVAFKMYRILHKGLLCSPKEQGCLRYTTLSTPMMCSVVCPPHYYYIALDCFSDTALPWESEKIALVSLYEVASDRSRFHHHGNKACEPPLAGRTVVRFDDIQSALDSLIDMYMHDLQPFHNAYP